MRSYLAVVTWPELPCRLQFHTPYPRFRSPSSSTKFSLSLRCNAKLTGNCCLARTSVPVPTPSCVIKSPSQLRPLFSLSVNPKQPGRCSRPELHAPSVLPHFTCPLLSTVHSLHFPPPSVFRLLVLFRSYLAGVARPELQRSPARYLSRFMQSLSAPHASKSPRLYSSHSGSQVGSHSLTDLWRTKIYK